MTISTLLAIIGFVAGFFGVAYALARWIAGAITNYQEEREAERRSREHWDQRSRSSYRAF